MHYDLEHFCFHIFSHLSMIQTYLSHHFTLPHVCLMAYFLFHTYFSKTYITLYYLLFSKRNCLHLSSIVWFKSLALESKSFILAKVLWIIANFFEISSSSSKLSSIIYRLLYIVILVPTSYITLAIVLDPCITSCIVLVSSTLFKPLRTSSN